LFARCLAAAVASPFVSAAVAMVTAEAIDAVARFLSALAGSQAFDDAARTQVASLTSLLRAGPKPEMDVGWF